MQNQSQNNLAKQIKNYQLLQSNSQYFTVVRRCIGSNLKKGVKLSAQYLQRNPQIRIDYDNFIQSFIQVAYLIYTCKYYGLNPLIDPEHVRVQENYTWGMEKKFSIIIYYRFSEQSRENNSYSSIIKDIYKFLIDYHDLYLKNIKKLQDVDAEYETSFKNFVEQIAYNETKLAQLNQSQRERDFYLHLEQTDIFRQNSLLLRIKNTSMLDYIKQKISKFKLFKQKDVSLVNEYNNQKKKSKCDLQELKKKQKLIQKNIIQFFEQIKNTNQDKFRLKIESDHQNYKTKFIFVVFQLPPDPFLTRISKLGKSQESSMQIEQNIQKEKVPYIQYQIEYNSDKNSICVRLILSSISCSSQSIDYILFQSNVLSFESANINLEFVQDKITQKTQGPPKKNLAFRGSSCFNNKEPTLQKMLILMDLTMIAAKIYEPQLLSIRKNFMIDKDPNKLSTIYQKVNHYTKIFLRCAKKVYSQ